MSNVEMKIRSLQSRIDDVLHYLKPLLPLANSHLVEFFSADLWSTFIPYGVREEVEEWGPKEAIHSFWEVRSGKDNYSQNKFKNLINFILEADNHYLKPDGLFCLTVDQFRSKLDSLGVTCLQGFKLTEFMSDKKSHEVQMLSSIVSTVCKWRGVEYTVELGGGRGYLSSLLTMAHGMAVLNIDMAEENRRGATERNRKMKKQWSDLLKKAENIGNSRKNLAQDTINTRNTLASQIDLYKHVTEFVTLDTDVVELVRTSFNNKSEDINICLTGLHTCGNLGSTSLTLFTRCPSASVLCTVPCCYHLLTESTQEYSLSEPLSCFMEDESCGFPMSDYLKDVALGRNARMLASQSIDKYSHTREVHTLPLYYRALLEVLLKKYNVSAGLEGKMKKVAGKCDNFSQYVKEAANKLKINMEKIPLNDSELNDFDSCHRQSIDKLCLYYLLRLCLAQVVENLILLDRLLYLYENGFDNSILVKMFDPVVSPRCHAMISYRNR